MDLPDFDESFAPDLFAVEQWARVPELIRKDVEGHVLAHLPADLRTKLRDLHALGIPISSVDPFFHFGAGLLIRNLCREQLTDSELVAHCLLGNWDCYYMQVLSAVAEELASPSSNRDGSR